MLITTSVVTFLGEPSTLQRAQSRKTIVKHLYLLQNSFHTDAKSLSVHIWSCLGNGCPSAHTLHWFCQVKVFFTSPFSLPPPFFPLHPQFFIFYFFYFYSFSWVCVGGGWGGGKGGGETIAIAAAAAPGYKYKLNFYLKLNFK
jgi:hypothetical protein